MIKGLIKNTLTLLVAAIVLLATSGFTVFKHSCKTEQSTEFSFLVPDFSCDHGNHDHQQEMPSCCDKHKTTSSENCSDDDCCNTVAFVVKMDVPFDVQQFQGNTDPIGTELQSEELISQNIFTGERTFILLNNNLPPPLSGKELCIFLNQLNIPNISV